MSDRLRRNAPADPDESTGNRILDRLIRARHLLYVLVIGAIVLWKFWPTMEPSIKKIQGLALTSKGQVLITGTASAPDFSIEAVAQFKIQYQSVELAMIGGGTIAALEDILNHRADVAMLSRAPTAREQRIAVDRGDSLLYFPVAIGGLTLVAHRDRGVGALSIETLRQLVRGGMDELALGSQTLRIYGPDPNAGTWDVLLDRLEITERPVASYLVVADGEKVVGAVRKDPNSIGFASSLTFKLAADDPDLVRVDITDAGGEPVTPTKANIMSGRYPLYHYLYMCTTASRGALASGFVTYFAQPTGQRWVARRGFMPARLPAREIHLTGGATS